MLITWQLWPQVPRTLGCFLVGSWYTSIPTHIKPFQVKNHDVIRLFKLLGPLHFIFFLFSSIIFPFSTPFFFISCSAFFSNFPTSFLSLIGRNSFPKFLNPIFLQQSFLTTFFSAPLVIYNNSEKVIMSTIPRGKATIDILKLMRRQRGVNNNNKGREEWNCRLKVHTKQNKMIHKY